VRALPFDPTTSVRKPAYTWRKISARRFYHQGIPTELALSGTETPRRLRAHTVSKPTSLRATTFSLTCPRLLDLIQCLQILLKPEGVVTIEVPHGRARNHERRSPRLPWRASGAPELFELALVA
jgi:hypothetical protein